MYSLEDRIYFDGAAAVAATLPDNNTNSSSTSENSDASSTADNSSSSSITNSADTTTSDTGTAKDTSSAPAKDTSSTTATKDTSSDSSANSGKIDIDALIASILNTDTASSDTTHTTLVVSTAVENASEIAKEAQEHNITVVTYDPAKETLQQLFEDIQTALNGEKASSINFVTTDNSAAGFSLVSASVITGENISINNDVSNFAKETASLLVDGGRITVAGDASLTDSSFSALETAFADAAGVKVSFIDGYTGDVTTTAPDAMDYNIVFVDSRVPDSADLLKNLAPNTEVYFLDSSSDGVSQISNYLNGKHNVDSIQIITHGNNGEILLGKTLLSNDNISSYSSEIQNWGKSLTSDGDILIYACNTAETDAGKDFTNEISRLTGADVSVSTDGTGGPSGNWTLEYSTGAIEAAAVFDGQDYQYHLAEYTVKNSDDYGGTFYSLRWAVSKATASGDVINFLFDDTHTSYSITLGSDLTISHSITIDGGAGNASKIAIHSSNADFYIYSGTVSIKNMTFSNMTTDAGGAIYIASGTTVNMENLVFTNCHATIDGGAVYVQASNTTTVNITNSTFTKCYADNAGGAIAIVGASATINITNSVFGDSSDTKAAHAYSNHAKFGGAVIIQGSTLNLYNSKFYYNYASTSYGGALVNNSATSITNLYDGCTFTGNYATASYGGAICSFGTLAFESGTITFSTNSSSSGGAIYNSGNITCVSSVTLTFTGNTVTSSGGAIANDTSSTATLYNATFTGNTATNNGGAIYAYTSSTVNLYNGSFSSNTAKYGGAIYIYADASLNLSGTFTFSGNTGSVHGDAIYSFGAINTTGASTISETSSTAKSIYFTSITIDSTSYYGTLSIQANTSLNNFVITNTTNNTISISAGKSLTLGAGSSLTGTATISSTATSSLNFSCGTAATPATVTLPTISGGLLSLTIGDYTSLKLGTDFTLATGGALTMGTSSKLFLNSYTLSLTSSATATATATGSSTGISTIYGGADSGTGGTGCLSINDGNATHRTTISNITFTRATYTSVAIGTGDFASFNNCTFIDNAKITGAYTFGAIYNNGGGDVIVTNCTFSGNTSSVGVSKGGAISNYGTMVISNTSFSNNTTNLSGGAIWNTGTLTVSNCTFTGNTAVSNGGAIFSLGVLNLSGSTSFLNNIAGANGSAIYNNETLNSSATLTDTSASQAGIYNTATGVLSLTDDATFTHFSITNAAAGTFTVGANTLTLDNSTVTGAMTTTNQSTLSLVNAASYTLTSNMTLKTLNIANGTLDLGANNLTIATSITGTTSTVATSIISGTGQVEISTVNPVTISNVKMTGGTGHAKLLIDAGANVSISNSIFSGNHNAGGDGSAIYNAGTLSITGSTFNIGNTAANGGVIYNAAAGVLTLSNSTFTANTATINGGAIYNAGILTLTGASNIIFEDNTAVLGDAIYNNGTLNVSGGVNVMAISMAATDIYIAGGKTLSLTGDAKFTNFTIANNGTFTIGAYTLTLSNTAVTGALVGGSSSSVKLTGGTLATPLTMTLPIITNGLLNLTIDDYTSAKFITALTIAGSGNLNLGTSSNLFLNGYNLTLTGSITATATTATGISDTDSKIYGGVDGSTPGEGVIVVNGGSDTVRTILSNLTFTNATNSAVHINAASFANITNCTFSGNHKTKLNTQDGGGLYNQGTVTLSGTRFIGNSVDADTTLVGHGGAIWSGTTGDLTITNCTFTGNYVENGSGGAIRSLGALTITGSTTFTNNTATVDGGAIDIDGGAGAAVSITGTTFGNLADAGSHNVAVRGGAVYIAAGYTASISNSSFYYNTATGASGGAVYTEGTLTFNGSQNVNFKGNVSTTNGNAIYNNGTLRATDGVNLVDTTVASRAKLQNEAGHSIILDGDASFTHFAITNAETLTVGAHNLTLSNSSVSGTQISTTNASTLSLANTTTYTLTSNMALGTLNLNNATLNLGASNLTLSTSIAGTVTASSVISGTGMVIIDGGSAPVPVTISNVTMCDANGQEKLHINSGSFAKITSSSFSNNSNAGANGGAINNLGTLNLGGGTVSFSGNVATNGNAIYNNGTLNFSGGVNVSGVAVQDIYNVNTKAMALTGSATLMDLTVNNSNGGTFNIGANTLTVSNAVVTGALTGGATSNLSIANGTTFQLPGNLTLNDLTIGNADATLDLNTHNLIIAQSIAGASAATSNISGTGQVQISTANPVTISNVTMKDGHTILLINAGANVAVSNSIFNHNTAAANGGAIDNSGTLSLTNCSFTSNTAAALGGAVYSANGTVTISGTATDTINGNMAPSGSFIYIGGSAQLVISNWTGTSTDAETIYIKDGSSGMLVKGTNTLTKFAVTLCEDLSFNNAGTSSLTLGAGSSFANGTTGNISGDANDSLSFTYTAGVNSVLSGTIGSLTVDGNGNAMAMPGNLTVYSALSLSNGSLVIGANTLSLGGTVTGNITGGNTSSIAFVGTGSTTVLPTITGGLKDLILNGAGGTMTLGANLTVSNSLTLNAGYLDIANYDLTLEADATIGGTPSSSSFVMTSGTGDFIKNFDASNLSFTFALGNYNSGNWYYTPITISFTGIDTIFGVNSYVTAHLYATKESHVTENAYITRYWAIDSNAITNFTAEIAATYVASDVVTSEAVLKGMLYIEPTLPPPEVPEVSGWQTLSGVNTSTHSFTGTGITKFGNFTAYGHYTPPASNTTVSTVPPQNNDQQQQADPWLSDSNTNNNAPSLFAEAQAMMPQSITLTSTTFSTSAWNTFSSSLTSTANGLSNGESGIMVFSPVEGSVRNSIIIDGQEDFLLTDTNGNPELTDNCDYTSMSLWASRYEKHSLFKSNVDRLLDSLICA